MYLRYSQGVHIAVAAIGSTVASELIGRGGRGTRSWHGVVSCKDGWASCELESCTISRAVRSLDGKFVQLRVRLFWKSHRTSKAPRALHECVVFPCLLVVQSNTQLFASIPSSFNPGNSRCGLHVGVVMQLSGSSTRQSLVGAVV